MLTGKFLSSIRATALLGKNLSTSSNSANKVELPPKPLRPFGPWVAFVRQRKDQILRQEQNMTAPKLATILAEEWKNTDKTRYMEEYQTKRETYIEAKKHYADSLTDEQRQSLYAERETKRLLNLKRQLKKTNPPRLPRNPANIYMQERYQDAEVQLRMKHTSIGMVAKELWAEYRNMDEEQKDKYIQMQKRDMERFLQELTQWYHTVQEDPNLSDVVKREAEKFYARHQQLKHQD